MLKSSYYYICTHPASEMTLHCRHCPELKQEGQTFLGSFYYYRQAMTVAKGLHAAIQPCQVCSEQQPGTAAPNSLAVKPKARIARPGVCAGLPVTATSGVKKRQKVESGFVPVPKTRGDVNRVPTKHLPENY